MSLTINKVELVPWSNSTRSSYISREGYGAKPRVYFSHIKEDFLDNMSNRKARPHWEYRTLMPNILKEVGIPRWTTKFRWSQKAGCTCPCSPGFRLSIQDVHFTHAANKDWEYRYHRGRFDILVDVAEEN